MAHVTPQQRAALEARIRSFIIAQLRDICRAYGFQISGPKRDLQLRCLQILKDTIDADDPAEIEQLIRRINPPHLTSASLARPTPSAGAIAPMNTRALPNGGGQSAYGMGAAFGRPSATATPPMNGKFFKPSPFYEVLETVVPLTDLPDGSEMPQNRHTVRASLVLSPDQAQRLRDDKALKLMIYCGVSNGLSLHHPTEIAFPNQIEVKVNTDDVKSNFKGMKNKEGTTKPADITEKIRRNAGYSNQIVITYALTSKKFTFVVHLVRHIVADTLVQRIKSGNSIPKHQVLEEMKRANADPDIVATSVRMSLKDPISTMRITLPVRSTFCTHNQCFDGAMFLQLQDQAPQWSCPVCAKKISFESLCVDKYFEEILRKVNPSIEQVDIEPDGDWTVIKDEKDDQPDGQSSRNARAEYDDDFDDDLVEVTENGTKVEPGVKAEPRPAPPSTNGPNAFGTPPISREASLAAPMRQSSANKRPAVIDLTSDDDDDPPRPAKRISMPQGLPTHTHPAQPNRFLPNPLPPGTADPFRPSSAAGRSSSANDFRFSTSGPSSPAGLSPNFSYLSSNSGWGGGPPQQQPHQHQHQQQPPARMSFSPMPLQQMTYPMRPPSRVASSTPLQQQQHPGSSVSPLSVSGSSAFRPPPSSQQPPAQPPTQSLQANGQNGYSAGWRSDSTGSGTSPGG